MLAKEGLPYYYKTSAEHILYAWIWTMVHSLAKDIVL